MDGQTARCTIHGGTYRILFSRDSGLELNSRKRDLALAAVESFKMSCPKCGQHYRARPEDIGSNCDCTVCGHSFEVVAPDSPAVMCSCHGAVPAAFYCVRCGTPICSNCAFPNPQGGHWCPDCAAAPQRALGRPLQGKRSIAKAPGGIRCARHPGAPAIYYCAVCRSPICATCDFAFPGGVHVCPDCASKPQRAVGARRRSSLVWSYVLAVWSSLGLLFLLSGALEGSVTTEEELAVLGYVIFFLVFVPAISGTAMAFGSLDRRLSNPASIWISVVWNSIILIALLILTIVGNFM